jgi:RimJ/RimL family protein N-acetyltransferase
MHNSNSETFRIETARLVIRPIEQAEIADFHAIAKRREIAENLASIPHPMSKEVAADWLSERAFRNSPDFAAGIFRPDGTLIGCIGISDNPVTTYYFFASEYWGHGYASEVLNPFLDWCANQYDISEIKVGVHQENLGSIKVLERSGFRQTHVTLFQPPFRDSPDLLLMYWKGYGAPAPLTTKTEYLFIHPIHPGHANRLIELEVESEIFQILGTTEPSFTSENTGEWIAESLDLSNVDRLAVTSVEGLLTGACELRVKKGTGFIKMWIGSNYWNKDYGGDAVRGLVGLIFDRIPEVETIVSSVTQDNTAINQLMRSIGFTDASDKEATANLALTRERLEN